jgi:hypothetical protein
MVQNISNANERASAVVHDLSEEKTRLYMEGYITSNGRNYSLRDKGLQQVKSQ